jgi:hypothetical protein
VALALAALGVILMASNPWFAPVDDEIVIVDVAAKPALQTVKLFLSGRGQHEHPPLSDLVLHGWLSLTNGNIHWLRFPSVVFYFLGAWFLVQAARRLGGDPAGYCTLILLLFWPYGFHFGRIAGWYSFTFMLVSLLTLLYLSYLDGQAIKYWLLLGLCALALIYTNYFGWALLAFLGLDFLLRFWRETGKWVLLLSTGALLVLACVPIMPAFLNEAGKSTKSGLSISALATGVYNLYCLFVSESVAPWFWALGIAAGLAIGCAMLVSYICAGSLARRFLLYFCALLAAMTFLQIGNTKRMLMISPWLILPVGVAIASSSFPAARRWLAISLVLVGAIGWFGIFSRNLYAAPHWVEPWKQVSLQAAEVVRSGDGIVIGNNPSLFFYLTYLLPSTDPVRNGHFAGFLPATVRAPNVYSPQQWIDAGSPVAKTVAVFDGLSFEVPGPSMDDIRRAINSKCEVTKEERFVHDSGAQWKQKYQPISGQREWRILVTSYGCSAQ